jgi:hypothetical protein
MIGGVGSDLRFISTPSSVKAAANSDQRRSGSACPHQREGGCKYSIRT